MTTAIIILAVLLLMAICVALFYRSRADIILRTSRSQQIQINAYRDADSRTLAEHLFRYIEAITPDYIQIENVEELCHGVPLMKMVVHCQKTVVALMCVG